VTSTWKFLWINLVFFTLKQIRACIFAGYFFSLLLVSNLFTFGLARYDFLFLGAIAAQAVLLKLKVETWNEVKVIFLFHLLGFGLELFKTHIGQWSYPENAIFKIHTVPLFSGFMYSAVASYVMQSFKLFQLSLSNYPNRIYTILLSLLIYLNFFTNYFFQDIRWWVLFPLIFFLFARTQVHFSILDTNFLQTKSYQTFTKILPFLKPWKSQITTSPGHTRFRMPLLLSFLLISFFIWIAENLATLLNAYKYGDQLGAWETVDIQIISSWILLFIVSFITVVDLKHFKHT
jgi:uncharacterized membrane protein YoaT (DUF817 family)